MPSSKPISGVGSAFQQPFLIMAYDYALPGAVRVLDSNLSSEFRRPRPNEPWTGYLYHYKYYTYGLRYVDFEEA